jgi:hypothetical protein
LENVGKTTNKVCRRVAARQTGAEHGILSPSHPERVASQSERTPEELAELRAERTRFSRERPGPEQLVASGEHEGPYRQGNIMALLTGIALLKLRREEQRLSLVDVSERSGLDCGMLSRLENGKILNP